MNEYKGYKIKYEIAFCQVRITISKNDGNNLTIWTFARQGVDVNYLDSLQMEDLAKSYINAIETIEVKR